MKIELKDIFTIATSSTAIIISCYQLWDVRRKKIKIYFGSDIRIKDDMITHHLVFSIINKRNRPLHIFNTRFYLYPLIKRKFNFSFFKIFTNGRVDASLDAEGHLYDCRLEVDKTYKIEIEAFEIYSYYTLRKQGVRAIKIELVDLDGKKYKRKVKLNQLEHDESNALKAKEYCFPAKYYKYEDKIRRQKRKELKYRDLTFNDYNKIHRLKLFLRKDLWYRSSFF